MAKRRRRAGAPEGNANFKGPIPKGHRPKKKRQQPHIGLSRGWGEKLRHQLAGEAERNQKGRSV